MAIGTKTGGRKKGVPNKSTNPATRDRVEKLLTILDETIEEDVRALKGPQKAVLYERLMEYKAPKLARTEHTGQVITENYNVELTAEEMKNIKNTLDNDC